jgi:hypothetical protein
MASLARRIGALAIAGIGRMATDHSPFDANGGLAARCIHRVGARGPGFSFSLSGLCHDPPIKKRGARLDTGRAQANCSSSHGYATISESWRAVNRASPRKIAIVCSPAT